MKRLITFALLALVLAACGSAATNTGTAVTPQPTTPVTQATDTPTAAPTHFKVGQTVKVGDTWQINIKKASIQSGGPYDSPPAGTTYLVLSLAIQNISDGEQNFYGSAPFTLRDPQGQSMKVTYVSTAKQEPDGKVESGDRLSGDLVYSVPKGIHA